MNSKEKLEKLCGMCVYRDFTKNKETFELISLAKDLLNEFERLEKLEKEHNKLKERYKHRAETSNDLCKAVKQYEKAIEILKDRFEIVEVKEDYDGEYIIETSTYFLYITKEQYELLKEVLGNE